VKLIDIGQGFQLDEKAGLAFLRMKAEAEAAGHTIEISTAYRSPEFQKSLYARYVKAIAAWERSGRMIVKPLAVAAPGMSEHGRGNAVDLHVASSLKLQSWLWAHASTFDFYFTAARERHHLAFYLGGPPHTLLDHHTANLKAWKSSP
jgi:LAS superfamily LD-carboxypeptidase LdcB